jgi:mannosyltransferase PIG-V
MSPAVRAAWLPFVVTRLAVLLAGYLGVLTVGFEPGTVRFRISPNELINLAARWDAQWYLEIARNGYHWNGDPHVQQPVVFFPLMPIAMRLGGALAGVGLLNGGLLIALCAFFAALVYLYRLAAPFAGDRGARLAVWALAAYPFAVYFAAPYTEALYLLGAVAAFFHLERGQWRAAVAWGLLVGLSRPNGFLLSVPLAAIAGSDMIRRRTLDVGGLAAAVAPVAGAAAYSVYLYAIAGDPLAWVEGQAAWGRSIAARWPHGRFEWPHSFTSWLVVLHAGAALFILLSIVPSLRWFGLPFALFTAVNIFSALGSGGLQSVGRMTSVLFPAFMWIGAAVPDRHAVRLIALFSIGQVLVAVLFFTWRAIY